MFRSFFRAPIRFSAAALISILSLSAPAIADDYRRSLTPEERAERVESLRERAGLRSYGIGFETRQIEQGSPAASYREERAQSLRQAEDCVRSASTAGALRDCERAEMERRRELLSKIRQQRESAPSAEASEPPRNLSDQRRSRPRPAP